MVSRTPAPETPIDPASSRGYALWRASLAWQRAIGAALAPFKLTHVQYLLLSSIGWLEQERGERPTQGRLAEHAGTDEMMTSQVVRALESRGLVLRHADAGDGRARRLALTRRGVVVARAAGEQVAMAERAHFGAQPSGA